MNVSECAEALSPPTPAPITNTVSLLLHSGLV
uniref:Uncharacterized protein n=1 Tax=Anguilla anguilla TaxID=7936 RepID=A0A0E9UF06_ANGAN